MAGWIGVDLDGTLAHYDGWAGIEHVGEAVPRMLARVKGWVAAGREVRIFTARVSCAEPELSVVRRVIAEWCAKYGLPDLAVTNVKDFGMVTLYDDRCIQVEANSGRLVLHPGHPEHEDD